MRSTAQTSIVALGLAMACHCVWAEESGITAKLHPWGSFDPGAWKTVRVVTETLNEQDQVVSTSTTDTKTSLLDVDNAGVTLEIQSCMEVAGKRFTAEPQIVKQGFHGETAGPNVQVKEPVDAEVTIEGRKIPCKKQQLEITGPNGKTLSSIYYSHILAPYILKRETTTTDIEGKTTLSETKVEVVSLNMPFKIRNETHNGSYLKTTHKTPNGTVTTLAAVLTEVPGGIVGSNTKEVDKNGRLVRRSTLELLDYGASADEDRTGIFGRKRPPRHRKTPPR